jgi:hypothetical protein
MALLIQASTVEQDYIPKKSRFVLLIPKREYA